MGTTYQLPNLASYEGHTIHHHSSFASTMGQPERTRSAITESVYHPTSRFPSETQQLSLPTHEHPALLLLRLPHAQVNLLARDTRPAPRLRSSANTSTSAGTLTAQSDKALSLRDSKMVLHNLNIPSCISPKRGSLVDFAAQITALFWFESIKTLEAAEDTDTGPGDAS